MQLLCLIRYLMTPYEVTLFCADCGMKWWSWTMNRGGCTIILQYWHEMTENPRQDSQSSVSGPASGILIASQPEYRWGTLARFAVGVFTGWTPGAVWTLWRREKTCPTGNQTPIVAVSLLTMLTDLFLLTKEWLKFISFQHIFVFRMEVHHVRL
jgi:hypothetical protein